MRRRCRKKICRTCWHSWRPRPEVASESPRYDFCCDGAVRGSGGESSGYGRAAAGPVEGAAELVDVQRRLCGAAVFDAGANQFAEREPLGSEVGVSDDGRRKI